MSDRSTQGMAAIGGSVALASTLSPKSFLRIFGIPPEEVTGAASFGWRLFAVRTAWLSVARGQTASRGSAPAR